MKIIADSGSTKTAWRLISDGNSVLSIETLGINPFYQGKEEISQFLKDYLLSHIKETVTEIYFYGAGCAGEEKCKLVKDAILSVIAAFIVEVNSDLLGAARALCCNDPGIVCILGTGSNSCYY